MKKTRNKKTGHWPAMLSAAFLLLTLIPGVFIFWGCGGDNTPAALQALRQRNPETADFVAAYSQEAGKRHTIDLSGEYTPGQIPLFLQWDIRWGYEMYGGDYLALTGCGPTCLSMVAVGLTGNTAYDPLTVANFAEQNGYYCAGSGSYWSLISEGCGQFGLAAEELPLDEAVIRSHLQGGDPIICAVGAGDFTTDGHFLVLTGVNADGTITLHDPNSRINSQKSWDLQRVMSQISNLWALRAV